jgi:hypothetical protein
MVSSVCIDPDPHYSLTYRRAIISLSLQSSGERGRFGFFPGSCVTIHDPRRLVGLCRYSFHDQLVYRAPVHAASCRGHVVVSWPSLCILTWGITTPTTICLAILQIGPNGLAGRDSLCLFRLELLKLLDLSPYTRADVRICLLDP